jgi:hypothetical protein
LRFSTLPTGYAICGREDWLSRAIIALQRNDLRRRAELCGEVKDVADGRGAERINRLRVIANDGQPASARLEREDDRGLEPVCVLILIDKDMVEAATDIICKAWIGDHLSPVKQEITSAGYSCSHEQPSDGGNSQQRVICPCELPLSSHVRAIVPSHQPIGLWVC